MDNNTKLRIRISESEFRSVIQELLAEGKGDTFAMQATKKMMKSKGTKSAGKAPSMGSTSTENKPAAPKKEEAPKEEKPESEESAETIDEKKAPVAKNPAQILKALKAWLDKHMPEEEEGKKEEKKEEASKEEIEEGLGHSEISSIHQEGGSWIVTYKTADGIKEKVFKSEEEARRFYNDKNKK